MPAAAFTVRALLASARDALGGQPAPARADAEVLLAHALGRNRAFLYAHADAVVAAAAQERFAAMLARCRAGEPVAYIVGRREFWSLDLELGPATLVPRPETELLVELALQVMPRERAEVLDLGTGSGAVALALAHERPGWRVCGVDIDPAAVAVATRNAARLGIGNAHFLDGDWYAPVAGKRFDLVVSNPPYVRADDPCLDAPGLRFEPRRALASGADGLDALRAVAGGARAHLGRGAVLACEHGTEQGRAVRALLEAAGFERILCGRDLAGHERVTLGYAAGESGDG